MDDLVMSGWSATSPFGLGAEPFTVGLLADRPVVHNLDQAAWPGPYDQAACSLARIAPRRSARPRNRPIAV